MDYGTAGYCCEVQIFATLLKWPLAEISAIAKLARHKADFHWILCQKNALAKFYSLENIRISLWKIFASRTFIRKFRKSLDLAHITRCTVMSLDGVCAISAGPAGHETISCRSLFFDTESHI